MNADVPHFSMEEFARRGKEIYWGRVDPLVKHLPPRTVVALDIVTGEFETGEDARSAYERLRSRLPQAQIWSVRVGYQPLHHFGPIARRQAP